MTEVVTEAVSIPVTASGGAGKLEHLYNAVAIINALAVLCASVFSLCGNHYYPTS